MEMVTTQYLTLPVGQIAPSGTNPRRTFEEDGLAELADSLRTVGMIEPLIVRRGARGDEYLLVAGERRWRAAQIVGMDEVPVVVRDYDDRQAREVQLVENLQRKNVDAIQEAEGFRELMKDYGYTAEQIAERVGKKPRVIFQRLALIKLPAPVKDAVAGGAITTNHAILIARLGNPEHQMSALEYATDSREGVSVRDLDHWIKRRVTLKLDAAPFDRADAELVARAGSCEACPKRSGNARELFPEISSPDVCTDKGCYEEKVRALVNFRLAANRDLVQIKAGYEWWPEQPKHVYGQGHYTLIEKKKDRCESAAAAIVVFGDGVGNEVEVCIDPRCKKHHGNARASSGGVQRSAEDKAKIVAEKLKLKIATELRGRVVDAIVAASDGLMSSRALEIAAEGWWECLGHDTRELVRKRHTEWDADILPIGDLPLDRLVQLLVEFSLAGHLRAYSYGEQGIGSPLRERAEAAGVDWQAIERDVKAELSAPKGKGGKKKAAIEVEAKAWPEPDAEGQFFGMDCETLDFSDHGADVTIYLVETADGWRSNYEATIAEDRTGGLPMAGDEVFADREKAVAAACLGLVLWAERQAGGKKNRKQAAAIAKWAVEQQARAKE